MAFVMLVLLGVWGRSLALLAGQPGGAGFKLFNLLVCLVLAGLALVALWPLSTEILPGMVTRRSFGYRTEEIPEREIEGFEARGHDLYLRLHRGQGLLLARGVADPEGAVERLTRLLHGEG